MENGNESVKEYGYSPATRKLALTLLLLIAVFISLVTASVAWFINGIHIDSSDKNFTASSIGSYFAGGTGKRDDPYLLNAPVHVYNLSWLQYLGYFNVDTEDDDDSLIDPVYFEVIEDIDMDGLVIPPIGTEENPFVGNFNGGGHCISGAVISNYVSKTNDGEGIFQRPAGEDSFDNLINGENASIIGFFGVVGDFNGKLAGLLVEEDQNNLEISSKINAVYDIRLDSLTVRSDTAQSLMGLLAGYLNASVANVGIGSSRLVAGNNVKAINISSVLEMQVLVSRFSLIGEYNSENIVWETLPTPTGWGASIDMKSMFDWVNTKIYNGTANNISYVSIENYAVRNGTTTLTGTSSSTLSNFRTANLGSAGSFTFYVKNTSNTDKYTYLCGEIPVSKTVNTTTYTNRTGDYIRSGNNYLTANSGGTAITNSTSASALAAWNIDSNGYVSTVVEGSRRYLGASGTSVTLGTSASTKWTRDTSSGLLYCTSGGTNYYLTYDGGWRLGTIGSGTGYTISYNGTYLNFNGSSLSAGTSSSGATVWNLSSTSPFGGNVTTVVNGTRYYLTITRGGSVFNRTYTLETTTSSASLTGNSNNQLYATWTLTSNRYVAYTDGSWQASTSAQSLTISKVAASASEYALTFTQNQVVEDAVTSSRTENYYVGGNATYYPLLTTTDENGKTVVSNANTGYVVSGSSFYDGTSVPNGDIRVSKYDTSDIGNSLSSNTLDNSKVYTITTSGVKNVASIYDSLEKYADSCDAFKESIASNVYGLHFMDAQININNKITVDGAKIMGSKGIAKEYDGYELPRDSITFNVAESGFVNFYAGTYFPGNSCFFSFHHIIRDSTNTKITEIREISKIYAVLNSDGSISKTNDYVYRYTTDSSFTIPSGYSLVFDTTWLTSPSVTLSSGTYFESVFYFEIPVNEGEYALGSVKGKDGAYLIYLDLAASGDDNVAVNPSHSITGLNFVDDAGLAPDSDVNSYPVITITLQHAEGVTSHGGVSISFDRASMDSITYELSGNGAGSFSTEITAADGVSAAVGTVTLSVVWQSRRDEDELLL